jgi:hypothetical protein
VLGSNQRRLRRRFYRTLPIKITSCLWPAETRLLRAMSGRLNHSSTESQSGSPAMSGWHWPTRVRSDPNRSGALRRHQWSSMTNTCRPWQSATPRCRSGQFGCLFTVRLLHEAAGSLSRQSSRRSVKPSAQLTARRLAYRYGREHDQHRPDLPHSRYPLPAASRHAPWRRSCETGRQW